MSLNYGHTNSAAPGLNWQDLVAPYQTPSVWRSLWQVVNSLIPYVVTWYVMYRSLAVSPWLTLALSVLAAGFLVRLFIILHDCGHGAFFKSPRAADIVGTICGILTHTPYHQWRHEHAIHHASAGDLNRRGVGDVRTLTVKEYLALSRWDRLKYRIYRNPFVMFIIGPYVVFLGSQRFVGKHSRRRERRNVYLTNVGMVTVYSALAWAVGIKALLMIQLPIFTLAGAAGVWLFYVQHQYETTYWQRGEDWDYATAALLGSSYYKLPRVLQWFTGNIGLHHIHHLSPRTPNYRLQACQESIPEFQQVTVIGFWEGWRTMWLKLWDEERQRLIGFKQLKSSQ